MFRYVTFNIRYDCERDGCNQFVYRRTILEIGLEKPLKVLHVTDSHLPLYNENDGPVMAEKGRKRDPEASLAVLREEMDYAEANCDLIVHTGDLIDFASDANVAFARDLLKKDRLYFRKS